MPCPVCRLTGVSLDTVGGFALVFPLAAPVVVALTAKKHGADHAAITGALTLGLSFLLFPVALMLVLLVAGLFGDL